MRILDREVQTSLAEYISRPPISLKKIHCEPFKGRVLSHTRYSDYLKENVHMFDALDFLAERAGRSRPRLRPAVHGVNCTAHSAQGNAASDQEALGFSPVSDSEEVVSTARKSAWARLLARVYEVDPLVCPECGSPMKVIPVIQDIDEIKHILRHLIRIGRAPPGLDKSSLN